MPASNTNPASAATRARTNLGACLMVMAIFGSLDVAFAQSQNGETASSADSQLVDLPSARSGNRTPQLEGSNSQEPPNTKATQSSSEPAKPQSGTEAGENASNTNPAPGVQPKVDVKPRPQVKATKLLEQDFSKTWKLVAAEEGVKVEDVWRMNKTETGRILVCTGKPKGYLRTLSAHKNYVLSFEFRYPMDENGNSGVLLHIDGKDKVWPDGIQVQLHRPTAGSIFPSGNRKARFTIGAKLDLALKVWNKCRITVREDTIEVSLNDVAVGPMRYCQPAAGFIALQSEGSEVHFRNIVLTEEIVSTPSVPSVTQQSSKTVAPAAKAPDEPKPAAGIPAKTGTKDEGTQPADG
ncbi:MAG: family 16 glycoside hydrolase [Planctomycetaceae bacterium]